MFKLREGPLYVGRCQRTVLQGSSISRAHVSWQVGILVPVEHFGHLLQHLDALVVVDDVVELVLQGLAPLTRDFANALF